MYSRQLFRAVVVVLVCSVVGREVVDREEVGLPWEHLV